MSVPIWLTSGVVPPAIAVWSFVTAWPQSTGVIFTLTFGYCFMNASAIVLSFVPSLPIDQTVRSPLRSAAGLLPPPDPPAEPPGALEAPPPPAADVVGAAVPEFVPQAARLKDRAKAA